MALLRTVLNIRFKPDERCGVHHFLLGLVSKTPILLLKARLAKAQVLQQTGTAMLAQANASSQLAIQLIR